MHKYYNYNSVFSEQILKYVEERRMLGFLFDNPAYWLYRFDQFCVLKEVSNPIITKELFDSWTVITPTESKASQRNRLMALKNFSVYLNTLGISCYIPKVLPNAEKNIPYLLDNRDIQAFFKQVDFYNTKSPVKVFSRLAMEYKVLFRLIYCCGLRNSEACSLKYTDVDINKGILTIIHSKGNKDRLVYLAEDIRQLCQEYQKWLIKTLKHQPQWFFPGRNLEKHIPTTSVDRKFNEFWNQTEQSKICDKKPTVHCLRYSFVIKRMNLWMENDIDLQTMMPYLSRYLGHSGIKETYYYYHQVEDAFKTIRKKDKISSFVIPEVHNEEDEL